MANILGKIFSKNQSQGFVKQAQPVVAHANSLSETFESLSREELKSRLTEVRNRTNGVPTDTADIAEVFALVREAA